MTDLTSMCKKNTYERAPAAQPSCIKDPENEEMDPISQMCYPKCAGGYVAAGPVCWRNCPTGTKPCGGALCADENDVCSEKVATTVSDAL